MAIQYGNAVVIDGGEIAASSQLDGAEVAVPAQDGQEVSVPSVLDGQEADASVILDGAEINLRSMIDREIGGGGGGGSGTDDYNDLIHKPKINGVVLEGDKSSADLHIETELVTDLGSFDVADYDWDYWEILSNYLESGFYKFYEEEDGFYYFFRTERAENCVYQEMWTTEEGSFARYIRRGVLNGDEWDFDYSQVVMQDALDNYYTKNETNTLLAGKVDNATLDNYYTSDQVDDLLDGFAPTNMVSITWANLVALRDSGQLTPGAYYRITDYNFVTSKLGIQSGNHQFDIIVLAISESMLSESAYAARHAGDHYFEREVTEGGIEWLYTLYVDDYAESYGDEPIDHADDIHGSDVFCYADTDTHPLTGEEVPILYKTAADEYDFDDPDFNDVFYWSGTYDIDGDDYDLWAKYEWDGDDWVFMQQYALTPIVVEDGELIVSPIPETKTVPVNMNAWELKYCLDNDKELFAWADTNGKGVIYYMKDEFGNEAPYDFKNVMYQRRYITAVSYSTLNAFKNQYWGQDSYSYITTNNNSKYFYTFHSKDDDIDASLFGQNTYNTILPWVMDGQRQLNNIVLFDGSNNDIKADCHDITISGNNNTLASCYYLLLAIGSSYSTFLNNRSLTIAGLSGCKFGSGSREIWGSSPSGLTVEDSCYNINLATNLYGTTLKTGCSAITFNNYCGNIEIGQTCSNISFGTYNLNITIGKQSTNISTSNYYRYCTFEDNVSTVTLNTTSGSTTNFVQYVKVCKGVSNITQAPTRKTAYEQIYYKTGRVETAV